MNYSTYIRALQFALYRTIDEIRRGGVAERNEKRTSKKNWNLENFKHLHSRSQYRPDHSRGPRHSTDWQTRSRSSLTTTVHKRLDVYRSRYRAHRVCTRTYTYLHVILHVYRSGLYARESCPNCELSCIRSSDPPHKTSKKKKLKRFEHVLEEKKKKKSTNECMSCIRIT